MKVGDPANKTDFSASDFKVPIPFLSGNSTRDRSDKPLFVGGYENTNRIHEDFA